MIFAAIDQGTTSTRTLVVGRKRPPKIVKSIRHRQYYPRSGWVEHDPIELLSHVQTCMEAAGEVDAIGIDNQGESCLAWDAETGEPVSKVIVWQDNRTLEAVESLRKQGCEPLVLDRAGLPLDPYFSASKLSWIMHNVAEAGALHRRGRLRLGTTDAFFLDRLTGRFVTDATTASRTSLMNLSTGAWDSELCRMFGVPEDALPPIVATAGETIGTIGRIPLTASVVDQQAALYGHGCRRAGDAKITFGTGAFALAVTGDRIARAPELGILPTVAWRIGLDTTYAVDGGVYDAGSVIEWLARLQLMDDVDAIDDFGTPAAIERGLAFVPALSGLACPYWDRNAAGLWIGLSADTTRSDMCQAALEGIALLTARVVDTINDQLPLSDPISIDGGLTANSYFTKFLAHMVGRRMTKHGFAELTAFGCASLAALALGETLDLPQGEPVDPNGAQPLREAATARFAEAVRRSRLWRTNQAGGLY